MDTLQEFLKSRKRPTRIEPQHAETLLRPKPDIARGRVPRPTPRLAQPLSLGQVCFAFTEGSFRKLPLRALLGLSQCAPNGGCHPRQTGFGDKVCRAKFECLHPNFFAKGSGYKDERHTRRNCSRYFECRNAVKCGKGVVGQN